MHPFVQRLREERANNWSEMQAILDTVETEKRDISAEEMERFDRLNGGITDLDAKIAKFTESEARAAAAEALREEMAPVLAPKAGDRQPTDRDILRQLIGGERREFEFLGAEQRAMSGNQGGASYGTAFADQVLVYERSLIPVLNYATVLQTAGGAPIQFPRLTADIATSGTVTAEAAGITELDPTLSTVTLSSFKYAAVTLWSRELDEDQTIGLPDLVARTTARELANSYGTHLTSGTGTTQPNGIVNGATNGGTALGTASGSSTDTFFSPTDMATLYYGLAIPYRASAVFMVSTTAMAKIRTFRDANKQFIWTPGINGSDPDRFMGIPIVENPAMAAVASASKSVLVGDPSRYYVRRVGGLRVERSTEYKFSTDQVALKSVVRLDGAVVDAAGLRYLVSANT